MKFLEKDLEDIIFETDRDKLDDRGLYIDGILKRQLNIGNYGIADLVSISRWHDDIEMHFNNKMRDNHLNVTIYELKKDNIDVDSFFQALRYLKGISRYLIKRKPNLLVKFNIVLIGRKLDTSTSLCYLPDFISSENEYSINSLTIYTYHFDAINGIEFKEESDYNLVNEGF